MFERARAFLNRFRDDDRTAYVVTGADTLSLVLGILGVTQSLAISKLVDDINSVQRSPGFDWHFLPHWALAFCVVVKVFETVFLGAVDSMSYRIGFHTIATLFALGGFQNWAFDAITLSKDGATPEFHQRLMIFSTFAMVGYSTTLYGMVCGRMGRNLSPAQRAREVTNEVSNLVTAYASFLICMVGWFSQSPIRSAILSATMATILVCNVTLSFWIANVQMVKAKGGSS